MKERPYKRSKVFERFDALSDKDLQVLIDKAETRTKLARSLGMHAHYYRHLISRLNSGDFDLSNLDLRARKLMALANLGITRKQPEKSIRARERFEREVLPVLFVENSPLDGKAARRYISGWNHVFGWLTERCDCGLTDEWQGKPIRLQIDHKNGVDRDHRLENLRYLCPNCHSQTDTFTGRNIAVRNRLKKLLQNE